MKIDLIRAGGDAIAEKVREQLLGLSVEISGPVADAVALSMIAGAAAAYRELSVSDPHVQAQHLQAALGKPLPAHH